MIERAVTLETGPIIRPESLPESLRRPDAVHVDFPQEGIDPEMVLEQIELDLIRRAPERVDGVQSRAANPNTAERKVDRCPGSFGVRRA